MAAGNRHGTAGCTWGKMFSFPARDQLIERKRGRIYLAGMTERQTGGGGGCVRVLQERERESGTAGEGVGE